MNQDNQVGWENEMVQFAEKYLPKGIAAPSFFLSDLSKLIRLVKRDSYAEGIRRARERVLSIELYNSDEIDRHAVVKAFDDIEEEVKK